jgi:hypothetical protein
VPDASTRIESMFAKAWDAPSPKRSSTATPASITPSSVSATARGCSWISFCM